MKLLIMGKGPSRLLAPKEFDGEVWGLNDLMRLETRTFTRWFEMHENKEWRKREKELVALEIPVYMQKQEKDIPFSQAYPLDEMIGKFGTYFTNSVSYMLALAIQEEFDEIHLYGADMQMGDEYSYQVPSIEYYLGIAVGQGIGVFISTGSTLLKTDKLYGYNKEV